MTKTKKNVTRETEAEMFEVGKYRPIVVTIKPKLIGLRLKGQSKEYNLPIEKCFYLAVLAEKKRKKPERKTTKRIQS